MRVVPKSIPESERPEDIADELRKREFDPSRSRAIIFTVSRNDTEDLARQLNLEAMSQDPWKGRVRWYHAGMTADERAATYEGFREGDTAILCATKAFGMGMDIPNIHYVFHLQPPYSLEDYIQQIGRAGRDKSSREEAGFGEERPIRCVLYAETEDFETLHGRLKASRLSWGQVSRIQDVLHDYASRLDHHKPDPDSAIPVPTDLVSRHEAFEDVYNASTMQKTGFHWLKRLERIRQEYYVPAHLELANEDPETDRATTEETQALCRHVETIRQSTDGDKKRILVNTGHLFNLFDINTSAALFEHLRTAQEAGHIRVFRTLSVQCSKNHADVIRETTEDRDRLPPRLVLAFHLAGSIVAGMSHDRFFQLDSGWFTDEVRKLGREVLSPSEWEWIDDKESREEYRSKAVSDLQQGSRARAVLFLVRHGPNIQFRSTLEGDGEVFEMRITSKEGGKCQQEQYLSRIRDLTKRLLALIYEKNTRDSRIDLMSTLDELDLEGEQDLNEFEQTLLFLERIGFLKISGGLLPMAIETYLRSKEPIDASDQESEDFVVREQFQQAGRLKELRLFALRVLSSLEEEDRQNAFIKQYLRSEGPGEVLSLLDETLNGTEADPGLLSALREEALQEEVDRLSEDQEAVYDSPLNQSTLVSAGPGSGKTHTLLLRLARLIHEENVSPSKILVLAYNRAVVTEVKSRLRQLFETLGYRDLSRRLRVFTFHGLIRYVLGDEVDTDDLGEGEGDPWADTFIKYIEKRPGRIGMHLSPETIQYIFVDEFQDITEERYRILRWIAGDSSHVTAIGDPDQSIYGYERAANGQARSAQPFFDRFEDDFGAEKYRIADNFRSLPDIIERADNFIQLNDRRAPRPSLEPQRTCPDDWDQAGQYVECNEHNSRAPWLHRLKELLNQERPQGGLPRDVAALFRSNAEVYRGYRLVHEHLDDFLQEKGIPVVVQGATRNWLRVREIAYCLDQLRGKIKEEGEDATFLPDESAWNWLVASGGNGFPDAWDDYTLRLVRCVIERFEMEQTDGFQIADLVDHIKDTFRRDKGQIYKLLQVHETEVRENEDRTPNLVLSNLHKVKGLEYDTVVMPASFQPLPFSSANGSASDLDERIEEERRVYFVGMTRARNQLIRYEWARERHLREGKKFKLKKEYRNSLGVSLEADAFAGHVKISKCADEGFLRREGGFRNGKEYLNYMRSEVKPGDPLTLVRERSSWYVQHGGHRIAELASKVSGTLERQADGNTGYLEVEGITVSDIVRYTHEDSLEYDRENDTGYTDYWSEVFKDEGYTYLINFAGFAQTG
jgi:ATP-dependent DNA helicase RecQ